MESTSADRAREQLVPSRSAESWSAASRSAESQSAQSRLSRSRSAPPPSARSTAPPRLAASWRRSTSYGISPDSVSPAFAGTGDDESLFFESGQQVLRRLHETLNDEPVSLMLTDPDGLVLSRLCSEQVLLRALDDVYLAPGFDYSERETGTTGLGLALADRAPSLVRAEQHYCSQLWGYTCAAAPVEDPTTGELVGSVNLTTWSEQSYNLLLALTQTASHNTEALMLARGHGRSPRPQSRGRVFRIHAPRAGDDELPTLSPTWRGAVDEAQAALDDGRTVAVAGEAGVGKTTLLGDAHAAVSPTGRILSARAPEPPDVEAWLSLWAPELGKPGTSIVVGRVDRLPAWAAAELARLVTSLDEQPRPTHPLTMTTASVGAMPHVLGELVDVVVEVPALRHRLEDVVPLARHFARQARGRDVQFTPAAEHALSTFHWPGNVTQLRDIVRTAVSRADIVAVRDLPAEVFTGAAHRLTRMETIERDEIVRSLSTPGATVSRAASELGMSRATIYRRISQYGITLPGDGPE